MSSDEPLDIFNVLIADDEKLIQSLVYSVLLSLGFRKISIANSGRSALGLAAVSKFDFIITDWRMGDLNGIDIVQQLRQNPHGLNHKTPIIMLTGNTEASYVKTAITAGINGYLIKPFTAEQLAKRIHSIIESPSDFVICRTYSGPDRRRTTFQPPHDVERRRARKKSNLVMGRVADGR